MMGLGELVTGLLAMLGLLFGLFKLGQRRGAEKHKAEQAQRAEATKERIGESHEVSDGLTEPDIRDRLRKLANR